MITLYTDGAARGNPGPGGYAGLLIHQNETNEYSGAYQYTTNNRMELLAVIVGLEKINTPWQYVTLYTDSRYIVDAIQKGWLNKWHSQAFKKRKNSDLWRRLLQVLNKHHVTPQWIKGHAGNPYNERCDQLAVQASKQGPWTVDVGYQAASPTH